VAENFPEECRYVLEALGQVYRNDTLARDQELSAERRLQFHQEQSGPVMEKLHQWLKAQLAEHKTEPNSGLGKAISYLLNYWSKLTLFLSQPGSPIDNNIVERLLKKAILNRRNAFFYKTLHGAHTGDLFMSLIHTCELNGAPIPSTTSRNCGGTLRNFPCTRRSGCRGTIARHWCGLQGPLRRNI
jgi:transposase